MARAEKFRSLLEMTDAFPTERSCSKYLEQRRWRGVVGCPRCGSTDHYKFKLKPKHKHTTYKCKDCDRKFNCLTGTVMQNTKIPLRQWFVALYLFSSHKKGIPSCQMARDLDITQKSAWHLVGRLREMMRDKSGFMLSGIVEADESYFGGLERNKHWDKKTPGSRGRSLVKKFAALGVMERGGRVIMRTTESVGWQAVGLFISQHVEPGSVLNTDEYESYTRVGGSYVHQVVVHSKHEYARGTFHTNGIENVWSHVKRGTKGLYHQISRKHHSRYLDEYMFRFNTRRETTCARFDIALSQDTTTLTYKRLIGRDKKPSPA